MHTALRPRLTAALLIGTALFALPAFALGVGVGGGSSTNVGVGTNTGIGIGGTSVGARTDTSANTRDAINGDNAAVDVNSDTAVRSTTHNDSVHHPRHTQTRHTSHDRDFSTDAGATSSDRLNTMTRTGASVSGSTSATAHNPGGSPDIDSHTDTTLGVSH